MSDFPQISEAEFEVMKIVWNCDKTLRLIRNMTDSDLLDMHYFLTEDDNPDGDEFMEKAPPERCFHVTDMH